MLDSCQQHVCDMYDGPLMILAGPGTGKSHVLVARIVDLIRKRNVRSERILALGFTDRSTQVMEERVDVSVPMGMNHAVIRTFHGLCMEILGEYGVELGIDQSCKMMSKSQQTVFLLHHLHTLPLRRFAPGVSKPSGTLVRSLLTFFGRMQDGSVSVGDYNEFAAKMVASVNAAAANEKDARPRLDLAHAHQELAALFDAWTRLKAVNNVMDFHDLLTLTLHLFRERPSVVAEYAKNFDHVLVDEFQDLNPAMVNILDELLKYSTHDNICVAGDDDQAIFSFRGAGSSGNFLHFKKQYFDGKYDAADRIVSLGTSYRCSQRVLDASRRLVNVDNASLAQIFNIDKSLKAVESENPERGGEVKLYAYDTPMDEIDGVSRMIKDMIRDSSMKLSDIAILVRRNWDVERISRGLSLNGIPSNVESGVNLFDQPEIRFMLCFLSVITDPADTRSLYDMITSVVYNVPGVDVAALMTEARRLRVNLRQALFVVYHTQCEVDSENIPDMYRKWRLPEFSQTTLERIGCVVNDLRKYEDEATSVSVREVTYKFLRERQIIDTMTRSLVEPNAPDNVVGILRHKVESNFARFLSSLQEVESVVESPKAAFVVAQLKALVEYGADSRHDDGDFDDDSAVTILTIHKSKGTEFDTVFIMGCTDNVIPGRNQAPELPVPEALLGVTSKSREVHVSEERRLMYVAMTRARSSCIFTYARVQSPHQRRELKPSRFIYDALRTVKANGVTVTSEIVSVASKTIDDDVSNEATTTTHAHISDTLSKSTDNATNDGSKNDQQNENNEDDDTFMVSYSKIDTYLRCPKTYYHRYVLHRPSVTNGAMMLGGTLHTCIAYINAAAMDDRSVEWSEVQSVFTEAWDSSVFPSVYEANSAFARGEKMLRKFLERRSKGYDLVPESVEERFVFTVSPPNMDEYRVQGYIDEMSKVAGASGDAPKDVIVEYKTRLWPFQKGPLESNLQLCMYLWAYAEANDGRLPASLRMASIETGEIVEYKPTYEAIALAKQTLNDAITSIRAEKFDATPSMKACRFCDMTDICPVAVKSAKRRAKWTPKFYTV